MKKPRKLPPGAALSLPVLLLAALLWAGSALALWGVSLAQLHWDLARTGQAAAAALAEVTPADAPKQGRALTEPEKAVLTMRGETLGLSGFWVCGLDGESPAPLLRSGEEPDGLGGLLEAAVDGRSGWAMEENGGGWSLLCARPLYGGGGAVSGCTAVILDVTDQVSAAGRNVLAGVLAAGLLAAVLAGAVLWWLKKRVAAPLARLTAAAASARGGSLEALAGLSPLPGPLSGLAEHLSAAARSMGDRVRAARDQAAREAAEATKLGLAGEINGSVLPQALPEVPGRSGFEVKGRVEPGRAVSAYLYDYFFIDPGLLCVVIGDVPEHGLPASLFLVVAQTTIRSRLRKGRSLAETMADVNRQLHDLGNSLCLNALVGTLNLADGRFSYVNAGQRRPLILRNEDRYEWLEAPVYAPLGRNEHVSYRLEELRLRQGDRLFFYTAGMADLRDRTGAAFGEAQMRASLNLSRSRAPDLEDLLVFAGEEARAFSEQAVPEEGFALMALEYRKGEKELAHCDVPNRPERAVEVEAFLKRQFEDNGIPKRYYARTAVLVDELFALCCRWSAGDGTVMVECGIAPDAQMVTIRMTAALGGVDPLAQEEGGVAGDAAEFIRGSADFVSFKPGEDRDTIVLVSYLGE